MHTETFHEGDRVRVQPSVHLMPKFHGADGVVVAWCHDNIYRVKLDAFATESVFNASELKRLDSAFDCQYCSGHHTAENACVRYRQARAKNECDNCHESGGRHLVGCPIGHELASPTGDAAPALDYFYPWTHECINGKHGVFEGILLVAVVGECCTRPEHAAEFAAQIVREHNAHRKLVEALRACRVDLNAAIERLPPRLSDHADLLQCKALLAQIDAALALAEAQQ